MKRILTILILAIPLYGTLGQITNPKFLYSKTPQCQVMQIGITDSSTFVFFKYTNKKPDAIKCIDEKIFIRDTDTGKRYKLIGSLNIPLCPSYHNFVNANESHYFALAFEPIPKSAKFIDIVESTGQASLDYSYIQLEQSDSPHPIAIDYIQLLEKSPVRENGYFIKDGRNVQYFTHKGITIAINLSITNSYGNYFTASMSIENNSSKRIDFFPEYIIAKVFQGTKEIKCQVLTHSEFSKRVKNKQSWDSFFVALSETVAANQAGKTITSTQSSSSIDIASNGYYSGYYGDKYGVVSSNVRTYGNITTSSTTYSFDGTANYYARQNANRNISNFNSQQYLIRESINQGYLKANTIFKSQRINGYVNINYIKGDLLHITVPVDGDSYTFYWKLN